MAYAMISIVFLSFSFFRFPFSFHRKEKRNTPHSLSIIRVYPVPWRTHRDTRERVAEEMSTVSMTCR